jgi:hypothetical protein
MAAPTARAGVACALVLVLGAGCGDGGGDGEGRPTLSPSVSPSRTLPAPTRSVDPTDEATEESSDAPTQEPTPEQTDEPTEQPTEEESDRPTLLPTERPTERPTEQPTERSSTAEVGPTDDTPSASESAPGEDEASDEVDSEDDSVPSWLWWLLAAVVVGVGVLTWFLVARSRRRRAWQEQLTAAEAEVAWLARELLPHLRGTGSVEQVAGGWGVALPRVAAAEDQLTVLESTAPDEPARAKAADLRDAVREARARVEAATRRGAQEMWALDLDEAIGRLESTLAPEPGAQP